MLAFVGVGVVLHKIGGIKIFFLALLFIFILQEIEDEMMMIII